MIPLADNESDIPTLNSEDYDWRDWLPVLRAFEEEETLKRRTESADLERLLSHEENTTGSDFIYEIQDTGGEFQLEYSPGRRSRDGEMLWGTLTYNGDFDGKPLHETHQQIATAHASGYLETVNGYTDLAEITVPETYESEQLEEAIQAGIAIAQDAEDLEDQLRETNNDYEPSR